MTSKMIGSSGTMVTVVVMYSGSFGRNGGVKYIFITKNKNQNYFLLL